MLEVPEHALRPHSGHVDPGPDGGISAGELLTDAAVGTHIDTTHPRATTPPLPHLHKPGTTRMLHEERLEPLNGSVEEVNALAVSRADDPTLIGAHATTPQGLKQQAHRPLDGIALPP
eukprot:13059503-Alexandrium_andersonii.AAC.1